MATLCADGQCWPNHKQKQRQKGAIESERWRCDCHAEKYYEDWQNEIEPVAAPTNSPLE